jgi:hypothetical protein
MIAVGLQDTIGFVMNPLVHGFAITEFGGLVRPASFNLEIHAQFVSGNKGCLWRAVGMETQKIKTIRFGNSDDSFPFTYFSGWMAGLWKDATFECAANESLAAIDRELRSVS